MVTSTHQHTAGKAAPSVHEAPGAVYCPMCTRTVQVAVLHAGKSSKVRPGQKCPRCSASIDAGYVIGYNRAA
jgi:uncharacterized protein (UPF0212 family)